MVASRHIPSWLQRHVNADGTAAIEAAVAAAERGSRGEIVPMVVRSSAAFGHVLPLTALTLLALYWGLGVEVKLAELRGFGPSWFLMDLMLLLVLAALLSRLAFVRRCLTTAADLEMQVLRRAEIEFFEAGLDKTEGGTGILLFLSLADHRAVVLADKGIAAKLPPATWKELVVMLTTAARQGDLTSGFVAAVSRCGELLRPHFPAPMQNPDELRNTFVIKE